MNVGERWIKRTLNEDEWLRADFADLSIVVINVFEEWRVAVLPDAYKDLPVSGTFKDLPTEMVFERWDNDPKDTTLQFRPVYPPMPVVARPVSVLNLSPKGSASFFVGIPAWIEVLAECSGTLMPLTAFPTEELSKTWHGNHLAGHLGYALKTYARRVFEPELWPEYDIVCALNIVNEGEKMMPFSRLYLNTDHLSVFEGSGRLWSNAARIRAGGKIEGLSDVTYGTRPSKAYEEAAEVTEPRMGKVRRSTMGSTFSKVFGSFNLMDE